jgi:hypothetical protein
MSMPQVNRSIRNHMRRLKSMQVQLEGLYQRRFILKHEDGETDYKRKNTKMKMAQTLGMLTHNNTEIDDRRHRHIILTAIKFIENGNDDIDLLMAVLKQALQKETEGEEINDSSRGNDDN